VIYAVALKKIQPSGGHNLTMNSNEEETAKTEQKNNVGKDSNEDPDRDVDGVQMDFYHTAAFLKKTIV
jgi:hypothetical protein